MSSLMQLPSELLASITHFLPGADIKNVRLTCKRLHQTTPLRFSRVFLSPNSRNIEVLRTIAGHETLRHQVQEIIYDDARLIDSAPLRGHVISEEDLEGVPSVPTWFTRNYRERLGMFREYHAAVPPGPGESPGSQLPVPLSLKTSWKHYQKLLLDQQRTIARDDDAQALHFAIDRFPNLRRINLTPIAHGEIFREGHGTRMPRDSYIRPHYETPMIRQLPPDLIYPTPRGWPVDWDQDMSIYADPWDEKSKATWRGFCLVLRVLAEHSGHRITELVVKTNKVLTGINSRVFDKPNAQYDEFCKVLQTPGFLRLDLALFVGGQHFEAWHALRSGHLSKAIALATDLNHLSFSTSLETPGGLRSEPGGLAAQHVPLGNIVPAACWQRLRHFGLSRFIVELDDLLQALEAMSDTLQTVELSFLEFIGDVHYYHLLNALRDRLDWRRRLSKPRIILSVDKDQPQTSIFVDLGVEVERFVYLDGRNPFKESMKGVYRDDGIGTERFAFDPARDRPYRFYK